MATSDWSVRSCAVLGEITVEATAMGYAELVDFANDHPMLRPERSKGPAATALA